MKLPPPFGRLAPLVLAVAALVAAPAPAQQPPPSKPDELYATFREVFGQGKYDLAAEYLKAYLAANPSDEELLAVEGKNGGGTFQSLENVPKWSDNPAADKAAKETVAALVARVRAANDKILRDPARIARFVRNLGASYEERVYAEHELRRTGEFAVPFLVDAYRTDPNANLQAAILGMLTRIEPASVAGWVAALDGMTPEQRYGVFTSLFARPDALALPSFAETDYSPYLWYYAGLPADEAPTLRTLARSALGRLYPGSIDKREPQVELVRVARSFYEKKAKFRSARANADGSPVAATLWAWDGDGQKLVKTENVPVSRVEEYYGLKYARWALDRKADDDAAQRLILSLATERAVERGKFGELSQTSPTTYKLLADAPSPLLADILDEALAQRRTALALGLTQALSDRADRSVAQPTRGSGAKARPALLVRMLDEPDVRLQLAAANGLLRSGVPVDPAVRGRVLEVLRRAAAIDAGVPPEAKGQALIVDPNKLRGDSLAALLRGSGYAVEQYTAGRDVFRRVARSSDFDVIFVDRHVVNPELRDFLSQLRADLNAARAPILVVASAETVRPPSLDGLLVRLAVLIAATETDTPAIPLPYTPDIRRAPEDNDRLRAAVIEQRDNVLRTLSRSRMDRLTRVLAASNLVFTEPQRAFLKLRIEQVTWAALAADYPITRESAPATVDYLVEFQRLLAAQGAVPPYAGLGISGLSDRIERLQTDVDDNPAVKKRYDTIRSAIDVGGLGIDPGATRDLAAEAAAARVVRGFPAVTVVPEPFSRVGFEDDVRAAFADAAQAPRDPAEKKAAAKQAVEWLRQMATGELTGYDVTPAEADLRSALRSDDLAPAAIDAVARLKTSDAQQALVNVALTGGRPAPIRVRAADAAVRHVQLYGKMTPKTLIDALVPLAAAETNPDVRTRLVVLKGLLASEGGAFVNDLKQYTIPPEPVALPPADPAAPAPAPPPAPPPAP